MSSSNMFPAAFGQKLIELHALNIGYCGSSPSQTVGKIVEAFQPEVVYHLVLK